MEEQGRFVVQPVPFGWYYDEVMCRFRPAMLAAEVSDEDEDKTSDDD